MSNLKIDIIYYKTASDFEMEFNLSGCCRMRMFKDKVDTPKGLVNTLARDVARSKIIIIVTELFGDNTGVEVISKAIKLPLMQVVKENYGIKTTDAVFIPQTSVPLVTKSGVYGGCIIENGPQSIIIVSSARALRHEIMKSYVHNYVFDVAQVLAYQERLGSSPAPTAVIGKHSQTPSDNSPAVVSEAPAAILPETPEVEVAPANETPTEEQQSPDIHSKTTNNFTIEYDDPIIAAVDSSTEGQDLPPVKKRRKKGKATNIILLIIVVLLLLGFGILAYFFVYLPLLGQPSTFTDGSSNVVTEFLENLFS